MDPKSSTPSGPSVLLTENHRQVGNSLQSFRAVEFPGGDGMIAIETATFAGTQSDPDKLLSVQSWVMSIEWANELFPQLCEALTQRNGEREGAVSDASKATTA